MKLLVNYVRLGIIKLFDPHRRVYIWNIGLECACTWIHEYGNYLNREWKEIYYNVIYLHFCYGSEIPHQYELTLIRDFKKNLSCLCVKWLILPPFFLFFFFLIILLKNQNSAVKGCFNFFSRRELSELFCFLPWMTSGNQNTCISILEMVLLIKDSAMR